MASMETSLHRRRRILLHFVFGIGLPSLLLGCLAFRGIPELTQRKDQKSERAQHHDERRA